ncbi:hypothetical protein ACFVZW_35645 [Streptomyces sp. NPDC059567]|uniref:hypothetical protein n=1 Tax=Streptomyces sp. NPDC059567 TaxID=3346867 RepID=UPI0036BA7234
MSTPLTAEDKGKPAWSLMVLLTGAACAVLGFGAAWSWWALLWAPLLLLAVAFTIREWRVMAGNHWRAGVLEWFLLAVAHLGMVAAVALIVGV